MAMKKLLLFNFNYQITKQTERTLFPFFSAPIQIRKHSSTSLGDKNLIRYLIKMSNKKNLKIAVEGNIASGKSSIIRYLQNRFDVKSAAGGLVEPSEIIGSKKVLLTSSQNNELNIESITATDCYKNYKDNDVSHFKMDLGGQQEEEEEEEKENKSTTTGNGGDLSRLNVNLKVITEPVQLWRNLNGINLLELMYTDPLRWAYPFHSYVQLTMLQNHLELANNIAAQTSPNERYIGIMERSLFSAKYCFAENLYKKNLLTNVEYEILDRWFNWMVENHECDLDLIFYLRTKPETCLQRLHSRGRAEEIDRISMEYLSNLHELHEAWLLGHDANAMATATTMSSPLYKPASVIVIDADQSIDDVYKTIEAETRNAVRLVNC